MRHGRLPQRNDLRRQVLTFDVFHALLTLRADIDRARHASSERLHPSPDNDGDELLRALRGRDARAETATVRAVKDVIVAAAPDAALLRIDLSVDRPSDPQLAPLQLPPGSHRLLADGNKAAEELFGRLRKAVDELAALRRRRSTEAITDAHSAEVRLVAGWRLLASRPYWLLSYGAATSEGARAELQMGTFDAFMQR